MVEENKRLNHLPQVAAVAALTDSISFPDPAKLMPGSHLSRERDIQIT